MVAILSPVVPRDPLIRYSREPVELYDTFTGRVWSRKAVDLFVVSRIHGAYNWTQTGVHLVLFSEEFSDLTTDELKRFWNVVLPKTNILCWWSSRTLGDKAVKRVLRRIEVKMNKAQRFFEKKDSSFARDFRAFRQTDRKD